MRHKEEGNEATRHRGIKYKPVFLVVFMPCCLVALYSVFLVAFTLAPLRELLHDYEKKHLARPFYF